MLLLFQIPRTFLPLPRLPRSFLWLTTRNYRTLQNQPAYTRKPLTIMSWPCSKCTFMNPSTLKSNCEICLSPRPVPPVSSSTAVAASSSLTPPKWSCLACTFVNSYARSNCEICDTRASLLSLSSFHDLNPSDQNCDNGSSVGSVFFPLRRCNSRLPDSGGELAVNHKRKVEEYDDDVSTEYGDLRGVKSSKHKSSKSEKLVVSDDKYKQRVLEREKSAETIKILSYNVWFREELEMVERMRAIGNLIHLHSPDVICLQEVTPNIYDTFKKSGWWKRYQCSLSPELAQANSYFCMLLTKIPVKSFSRKPFTNSIMGRELCISEVSIKAVDKSFSLVVATSHLESPCPGPPKWDQMYSKERVEQAKESVGHLLNHPNVIFCGDMNWDDKLDGSFPLQKGWVDAWAQLRPDENGFTYDTKSNKMLTGNRTLQKRLDRCLCYLQDFKISRIEMIGMEEIPGLSHIKEKKSKAGIKKLVLPVLPSDHFGLLLTITRRV